MTRHHQLIEKITHRGPQAFKKFISILNISFPEAYRILESKYSGVYLSLQEQKLNPLVNTHVSIQQTPPVIVASAVVEPTVSTPRNELIPSMNGATALPNAIVPSYPDFTPCPPIDVGGGLKLEYFTKEITPRRRISVKLSDRFHTSDKISSYDMKSAKRGLLFLVNIINFKKKSKTRNGGSVDRDNLISLFRQMHFEVIYYEDITKAVGESAILINNFSSFNWIKLRIINFAFYFPAILYIIKYICYIAIRTRH